MKELSPHYQLEITREEKLDNLHIKVEARGENVDAATRDRLTAELSHHIKSDVGISTRIEVKEPGGIPRSMGKAQRVIDKRNLK